jgi:hypothetical protein
MPRVRCRLLRRATSFGEPAATSDDVSSSESSSSRPRQPLSYRAQRDKHREVLRSHPDADLDDVRGCRFSPKLTRRSRRQSSARRLRPKLERQSLCQLDFGATRLVAEVGPIGSGFSGIAAAIRFGGRQRLLRSTRQPAQARPAKPDRGETGSVRCGCRCALAPGARRGVRARRCGRGR